MDLLTLLDIANPKKTKESLNTIITNQNSLVDEQATLKEDITKLREEISNLDNYATVNYVDTQVAAIIGSAPETLNALNELAAALGNDPNFATTVATELGKKADKEYTDNQLALKVNIADLPTNHVTTDTSQTISGEKTFNTKININDIRVKSGSLRLIYYSDPNVHVGNDGRKTIIHSSGSRPYYKNDDTQIALLSDIPEVPDLTNMVTTDTEQTITGGKRFEDLRTNIIKTASGSNEWLRVSGGSVLVGLQQASGYSLGFLGYRTRPSYNSKDLALLSDIPSVDGLANMDDVELYVNNRLSDLGDLNSFNLKNGDLVGSVVMKNDSPTMPNLVGLSGKNSMTIGTGCESYEGSSLSAGYLCVTSIRNKEEGFTGAGWASQAFGFGTHTVKNCEMAIGHYNAKRENVLFDVGIGKSANDNNGVELRMSGFEVYDGGSGIKVYDGSGNVSFEVLGNGSSKAKTSIVTPAVRTVVANSERQMMSTSGDEGGNADKFTLNIGDLNYSTIKMLGKTKRPRYVTAESGTTVTSEIALLSDITASGGGSKIYKHYISLSSPDPYSASITIYSTEATAYTSLSDLIPSRIGYGEPIVAYISCWEGNGVSYIRFTSINGDYDNSTHWYAALWGEINNESVTFAIQSDTVTEI